MPDIHTVAELGGLTALLTCSPRLSDSLEIVFIATGAPWLVCAAITDATHEQREQGKGTSMLVQRVCGELPWDEV